MRRLTAFGVAALFSIGVPVRSADSERIEGEGVFLPVEAMPESPSPNDFASLRASSPFARVLDPAETFDLKGIAIVNEQPLATLYNRETKQSVVVNAQQETEAGIKLVGVDSADSLEAVKVLVSFAGEEVELKYELEELYPQGGGPGDAGRGDAGKGEPRRGPSKQDVDRFRSLSQEQQAKLRQYIGHVMKSYPNISREERGNLIRGAMMRLTDGRDLEIPESGGSPPRGGRPDGNNSQDRR
ncbi:MAG: hypothetical protein AAGA96_04190 [Verrucomicrobiota bacterium]